MITQYLIYLMNVLFYIVNILSRSYCGHWNVERFRADLKYLLLKKITLSPWERSFAVQSIERSRKMIKWQRYAIQSLFSKLLNWLKGRNSPSGHRNFERSRDNILYTYIYIVNLISLTSFMSSTLRCWKTSIRQCLRWTSSTSKC